MPVEINGVWIHDEPRYTLDQSQGYSFPDGVNFFTSPIFYSNARADGYAMVTVGDLVDWWVEKHDWLKTLTHYISYASCFRSVIGYWGDGTCDPSDGDLTMQGTLELSTPLVDSINIIGELRREDYPFILIELPPVSDDEKVVYTLDHQSRSRPPFRFNVYSEDGPTNTLGLPGWQMRVMNYTFTPDLKFLSTKKDYNSELFFGIELEISTVMSVSELQHIVMTVEPKQEDFFFAKDDSSVSGKHGLKYELVTFPMTPKRQRREWKIFFEKLERLCEAQSMALDDVIDTSAELRNGIHIHLSKSAFIETLKGRQLHMNRFVTAWNLFDRKSQSFYKIISRRMFEPKDSEMYRVHAEMDGLMLGRRLARGVTINRERHHHACCHVTRQTVELRVFQGWMNLDHMLACIDITEATFEFSRICPMSKFNSLFSGKFKAWLHTQSGWKHAKEIMSCV